MADRTPSNPPPTRPDPTPFVPDADKGEEENVKSFWVSLEELNPDFAQLLKSTLPMLLPLPDAGALRNTRRVEINRVIGAALDKPPASQEGLQ